MTPLTRVTGKLFGGSAPLNEIGQFGSAKAGTLVNTQDVATIQALPAYSNGWGSAVISNRNFPPIEEVTGVLKTLSYQNCYLLQEGIPAYDIGTEYSNTSVVKSITGTQLKFFISLSNNNIGNPLSDGTYWAEADLNAGRNLGEIIQSTIPLSDAGLHLLDGSLISGSGSYAAFVNYIADIYNSSLNYFCSEADWQTSVTNYGVCGKFVYDSVNNTVRLPKITGFVEGASGVTTLGDLTEAGLPNITGSFWVNGTDGGGAASGAFAWDTNATSAGQDHFGGVSNPVFAFDASRSSAIYGNASTVQPQSIKVLYYIVVATSTKTDIEVDIDEIATDLNGKADVDLSNINASTSAKNTINGWGIPDYTAVVSLGEPTAYQTLPCDCYVYFSADTQGSMSGEGFYYANSNETYENFYTIAGTYQRHGMGLYLPKGWKVKRYNSASTIYYCPLKGAS